MIINIPDWAKDGYIKVILNDMELVAYKEPGNSPIMIKTVRCNNCGECCLDMAGSDLADEEGKCKYLQFDNHNWKCNAGGRRRTSCLAEPVGYNCSCAYKEQ